MTYTFLKFWCDHRTSANTANYPTGHPSECDCIIADIIYFILYEHQCDFVSHLPNIFYI